MGGFFDKLPVADGSAELVIACSALTADEGHGGDRGLREMERVCAAGGMVVIIWPDRPQWLEQRGYRYLSFPGEMRMEFASAKEAIELARIFYPDAVDEISRRNDRCVPYDLLGVNPPRDLAYKTIV
jgi:SAM-dependent methyltransferase